MMGRGEGGALVRGKGGVAVVDRRGHGIEK